MHSNQDTPSTDTSNRPSFVHPPKPTFWQGLEVENSGEPLNENLLKPISDICLQAITANSRLACFEFYLILPADTSLDFGYPVPMFLETLTRRFQADLRKREENGGRAYRDQVHYLWMKIPESSTTTYRVMLLVNSDSYFCLGESFTPENSMIQRVQDAWMKVIDCEAWQITRNIYFPTICYRHFDCPRNGFFRQYEKLFYLASSFASATDHQLGWSSIE